MDPTALPLLTAAAARAADADAIAEGDTPDVLMARAAGHLARTILAELGRGSGLRIDLVVGRGDNGGDGSASAARERWIAAGGAVRTGPVAAHLLAPDGRPRADVVVDCLLGTGANGPLRGATGEAAAAIAVARAAGATVVACDLPSGVDADDGSVAGGAVVADVTVTFGALKRGLLLAPALAHCGRVHLGRLGERFATAAAAPTAGEPPAWWMLTAAGARPDAPDLLAEKRRRGVVLVVAGRTGTAGAAALAGHAALAAGAGLVTVAVPEPVRAEVATLHPALMTVGLPADADGGVHADAVHALPLAGVDAVVVGPGLGTGAGAAAVVAHFRAHHPRVVLDADALNVHRDAPEALTDHPAGGILVLTPHARELDRLAGEGTFTDRARRVPELAVRWGAHVVAKGPGTLSAAPDGSVHVSPFAVPTLATGGTGDVLAGMLGAALAALPAVEGEDGRREVPARAVAHAVARTVWWHAAAGERAAARARSSDATGVIAELPGLRAALAAAPVARTATRDVPRGRTVLRELLEVR